MIHLKNIYKIEVPTSLIKHTVNHLHTVGKRGLEGFALWAGFCESGIFHVTDPIIPPQKLICDRGQVGVIIDDDALHKLNVWLYENKRLLIAQIHSHPGEAYHSNTDDEFPVATSIGSISIVVPNFAQEPFSIDRCAIYQLTAHGIWEKLNRSDIHKLIKITE